MNTIQERTIEKIRGYIVNNDCHNDSQDYEIKKFEIKELECGCVGVLAISGLKKRGEMLDAWLCLTYRHIFIGEKGGIRAYGKKNRCYSGLSKAMLLGYYNI